MTKRLTILLDDDLERKLRLRQAKLIQKTRKNVSFSQVINEVLDAGLKNSKA